MKHPALKNFRRIVVKVGSSLLVDSGGGRLKDDWLQEQLAKARAFDKAQRTGDGEGGP